ncbi:MAG: transporter substrate-binding domain-containing protein [Oscillospiraceae bacterium]|nr:transporter substrate-binding domain-containing protein [Oscillospiraceae bacterium]MBR6207754.1 transporter substrate-binding domain-containing protein [Oscillospiraceae bacterium]
MSRCKRIMALLLSVLTLVLLCACGGRNAPVTFRVVAELDSEEFRVAFRKDDPLCDIVTAAMRELAADGQISRLSSQYLGADYSTLKGVPEALRILDTSVSVNRTLRIGIQEGVAPLSSSRGDGSFYGLIPDLCKLVGEKLGVNFEYMVINSDNVAAELGSGNIDCAWMAASFAGSEETCSLSPGWLRNSHELVVLTSSGLRRKNSLRGKVIGITDVTSLEALKTSGLADKAAAIWTYGDLISCYNALVSGDCDALVIDSIVAGYYM